jgi:ribonuclease HI
MHAPAPHFVLFSEASREEGAADRWRFVLQHVGGGACLSAADAEPGARGGRLELLAVVRGLEALDGPSRVTLLTKSRYVSRGISRSIGPWRERRWRWERFGQLVPIRDHDLWQRVDRAMRIHHVDCCEWDGATWPFSIISAANTAGAATAQEAVLTASPLAAEPALVIVSRSGARRTAPRPPALGRVLAAIERVRRGIVAGWSAFRQPAFTRAA